MKGTSLEHPCFYFLAPYKPESIWHPFLFLHVQFFLLKTSSFQLGMLRTSAQIHLSDNLSLITRASGKPKCPLNGPHILYFLTP